MRCLSVLLLAGLALPAVADVLRNAPRTGIYVESDYLERTPDCDWYFAAATVVDMPPPSAESDCPIVIRIRGMLNREGARLFERVAEALDDWPAVPTRVVLNSRGGDSQAALYMAGIIRSHDVFRRRPAGVATTIDESEAAVCFSACVILFAAGFERHALFDEYDDPALPSRLGIHSPGQYDRRRMDYDTSSSNRSIRIVRRQLESYFSSVGVSTDLVDAMFEVPFDELRLLTEDDARAYGLVR